MEVVIDSNVFFSALIARDTQLHLLFNQQLSVFAPEVFRTEVVNHQDEILAKSGLSENEFERLSRKMFLAIQLVPLSDYKAFLPAARKILVGHTKDAEFIALCIMKGLKLWTYEKRLLKTDYGISTEGLSKAVKEERP